MQYEAIILELMSRIKELEADVEELKKFCDSGVVEYKKTSEAVSTPYTKMTDEMIDICYEYGKRFYEGDNLRELAENASTETGMNKNSAVMYISVVCSMLSGEGYKRTISKRALEKYLEKISEEYGSTGLKKAIESTRIHIEYRKSCGHNVDSVEEVCNRAESNAKR